MGGKVDSPLINHKLTELYRFSREIEGKRDHIPNPFSGIFIGRDNPEIKARVNLNQDGKLDVLYHPVIKIKEDAGVVQSIEIAVDAKNESQIDEILQKILKRNGIPKSAIIKGERRREVRTEGIGGKWEIDLWKFKIGMLKIAYEFAVDSIDDFFQDADAIKISGILKRADYDGVEEYVKIGTSGLQAEIFQPFADYLDLSSKKHYLVLINTELGLICFIKLHDLFCFGVILSKNKFLNTGETIIGINDIDQKTFRKLSLIDAINECMGPTHIRFCYDLPQGREGIAGRLEISSPGYRHERSQRDEIPLYNEKGVKYPFYLHEILLYNQCHSQKKDE
ncbi:hypothetical protein [Saezia sanguinis]|uniref:hypothetical protein n=1 Tax=Saezia sanguinis TaxID=1965230 RepID=UPI00302EFA9B